MHILRSMLPILALLPLSASFAQTLQWAQATGGPSQEVWKDAAIDGGGNILTVGTLLTGTRPRAAGSSTGCLVLSTVSTLSS